MEFNLNIYLTTEADVLTCDHFVCSCESGDALKHGWVDGGLGGEAQIGVDLTKVLGRDGMQVCRLADGRGEHFGEADAHPVERGIARGVAQREDGQRDDRTHLLCSGGCPPTEEADDVAAEGDNKRADDQDYSGDAAPSHDGLSPCRCIGRDDGRVDIGDGSAAFEGIEVGDDLVDVLITQIEVALQAPVNDVAEWLGDVRAYRGEVSGIFLRAKNKAGDGAVSLKWHLAAEQLVEDDAERKDVRALVDGLAEGLLGRHVVHGADEAAGLGQLAVLDGARQAEVHHQYPPVAINEDVLRLQVAMDDPDGVRRLQCTADLADDGDGFPRGVACHVPGPGYGGRGRRHTPW